MNCSESKCGSADVSINLRVIFPVAASARNMSIETKFFSDRKMIRDPSGLIAGAMFISPPSASFVISGTPIAWGACAPRAAVAYSLRSASCQSFDSVFSSTPVTVSIAATASPPMPENIALPTTLSPNRLPR